MKLFVPIESPRARGAAGAGGAIEKGELDSLPVSVQHKMFELIAGPAILTVVGRPGAIITGQIVAAAAARAIGHHGSIAWVRRQVKLSPVQRGIATLHVARQRSLRRVVN